jgi:hypothetical protein
MLSFPLFLDPWLFLELLSQQNKGAHSRQLIFQVVQDLTRAPFLSNEKRLFVISILDQHAPRGLPKRLEREMSIEEAVMMEIGANRRSSHTTEFSCLLIIPLLKTFEIHRDFFQEMIKIVLGRSATALNKTR